MDSRMQAKKDQEYTAEGPRCGKCQHFQSKTERIWREWCRSYYDKEKELRCGLGGFAVKKNGWCKRYELWKSRTTK